MVSYIQTFWLVFSPVLSSLRLNVISPLSEFGASRLPNVIHSEVGTRRELSPTVAQRTRSTGWTTTAVGHLRPSQSCGLNQEELRSHPARPLSRVSPRARPHSGFLSAALGKCCSRLLGNPEIQGRLGCQRGGDAPRSRRSGPVVRLPNMAAARLRRLKEDQEPRVNLKWRFSSSKCHKPLNVAFLLPKNNGQNIQTVI